jgi:Ras family.
MNRKQTSHYFIFSVELSDTLIVLERFNQKINHRYNSKNRPVIALVANKIDLQRSVSTEEGKKFAEKLKSRYYEVSAATNTGIKEMFSDILIELKNRNNKNMRLPWYKRCALL